MDEQACQPGSGSGQIVKFNPFLSGKIAQSISFLVGQCRVELK